MGAHPVSLDPHAGRARVLVPVKAFHRAKRRLADRLTPDARALLARELASSVLSAAQPLETVVVCDDPEVAQWARTAGASICWTPGHDLNSALTVALEEAFHSGVARVVIAHADLPFADHLSRFAAPGTTGVVIVSDRHGEGTNVMSLPTSPRFDLAYGPGSRHRHATAAVAAGLTVEVVHDEALGWDVDEPADLDPPARLGALPDLAERCAPGTAE